MANIPFTNDSLGYCVPYVSTGGFQTNLPCAHVCCVHIIQLNSTHITNDCRPNTHTYTYADTDNAPPPNILAHTLAFQHLQYPIYYGKLLFGYSSIIHYFKFSFRFVPLPSVRLCRFSCNSSYAWSGFSVDVILFLCMHSSYSSVGYTFGSVSFSLPFI